MARELLDEIRSGKTYRYRSTLMRPYNGERFYRRQMNELLRMRAELLGERYVEPIEAWRIHPWRERPVLMGLDLASG